MTFTAEQTDFITEVIVPRAAELVTAGTPLDFAILQASREARDAYHAILNDSTLRESVLKSIWVAARYPEAIR